MGIKSLDNLNACAFDAHWDLTKHIMMTHRFKTTFGSYCVGAYLFSIPAFSYSAELGLALIPQLLGMLVVCYAVVDILKTNRISITTELKLYGIFGIWVAVTFPLIGNLEYAASLFTLIKVILVTLASAQLLKSESDFYLVLKLFASSIFLVTYFNFNELQYLSLAGKISGLDRFEGTLENANTAAIYSIAVIWASLMLFIDAKHKIAGLVLPMAAIILSLFILFYTGSKKGMLGILIFSILIVHSLWVRYKGHVLRQSIAICVALLFICLSAYIVYANPFYHRLEMLIASIDSRSTSERLTLMELSLNVWLSNGWSFLFGIGHDSFRDYNYLGAYSHNTITEVLVNNGLIGFILYGSFIYLVGHALYKLARGSGDPKEKSQYYLALTFLVLFLVFSAAAVLHYTRELHPLLAVISKLTKIKNCES